MPRRAKSPQPGRGAKTALLDALSPGLALRLPLDEAQPLHRQARRWHPGLDRPASAAFTPQYQSPSRVLPVLRDHLLSPLTRP